MADDITGAQNWGGPPQNGSGYSYSEVEIPFWASMLGATQSQVKAHCQRLVRRLNAELPRPATQVEVDALMEESGRAVVLRTLHEPVEIGLIAFFLWRGHPTRFPFWKPNPLKYNINVFPSIASPIVTGSNARFMWFAGRSLAYMVAATYSVGALARGYDAYSFNQRFNTDLRLKELGSLVKEKIGKDVLQGRTNQVIRETQRLSATASREDLIAKRRQLLGQMNAELQKIANGEGKWRALSRRDRELAYNAMKEAWAQQIQVIEEAILAKDDPELASRQQSDYESLRGPGEQMPSQTDFSGTTNTLGMSPKKPWVGSSSTEQSSGQSWDQNDGFDDDDASPIAASAKGKAMNGVSGLSAWDRVRQQAHQGQSQQGQQGQQATSNAGGWGSSGSDSTDSTDTRSQSQKEFDEMVERERTRPA